MLAGWPAPATSGNGMAIMVNGFGLPTPAAEIAAGMPAAVAYCMYQVPIMTMAYLPETKSLLASGYCCRPSAPFSMIPSLNICFQMVSAFTIVGLSQDTWPLDASVHTPGWTLSEMDCSVSWLNATWPAPCTKQPALCALNTEHTCAQLASVVGAVRWYLLNRSWLIHRLPAKVDPIGSAASLPSLVSPAGPIGAILDFQSGPSALAMAGCRLKVSAARLAIEPMPPPGAMSNTSGPAEDTSAGRMAASYPAIVISLNVTWMSGWTLLNALMYA